jgi:hypothetical protein
MQDTIERPNIEETYTRAMSATNLRFETREGSAIGAAGMLVAAGWSQSRVGATLIRLHSEWDGAAKPIPPSPGSIKQLAKRAAGMAGSLTPEQWANNEAHRWYEQEVKLLLQRLKSLPSAREAIAVQAGRWQIAESESVAASVIKYWLDQTCPACHGQKWAKGKSGLSAHACKSCKGTGLAKLPHGEDGRKLLNHIDDCVSRARASIRSRLSNMRK